jgi:hypothetical protein
MGGSNKLYIASLTGGKVEVYGIDQYTEMGVSPLSLTYEGQQGGANPAGQDVTISNSGLAAINWTAGTATGWITLTPETGTAAPSGSSTVTVGINTGGLEAGTYSGSVNISVATGATEVVNVELTVLPTPELSVSPLSLTYTSTNGSAPAAQDVTIENIGDGTLNWSGSADESWIGLNKTTGTAPDTLEVTVDAGGKSEGTYTGEITITGAGALSSPATVAVTLNVVQQTGSINVSANIAEATYIINGPESFSGSGTAWGVTGALIGTYTIVYGDVEGYTTPSSQSQDLTADGTITFNGEYVSTEPDISGINRLERGTVEK